MDDTAMDVLVGFGVRDYGDTVSDYVDIVEDDILNPLDGFLQDTTDIKLILDLWETALDDLRGESPSYNNMNTIKNDLGTLSKVWGFHIEEPNWWDHNWSTTVVDRARDFLATTGKDLIANVRPGGNRDASDPTATPHQEADQSTFNQLAAACDIISSFWYPHPGSNWSTIAPINNNDKPLYYLSHNDQNTPFWYTVEVRDTSITAESIKAIINWQVHRALVEGAKGILFYNWIPSSSTARTDVHDICEDINTATVNTVLDTTPLTSGVTFTSGGSDVTWAYRDYGGEHYLLVVDDDVADSSSKSFTVRCDIGTTQYADFELVLEKYASTQVDSTKIAPSTVEFSDTLSRGEAKFYRLVVL